MTGPYSETVSSLPRIECGVPSPNQVDCRGIPRYAGDAISFGFIGISEVARNLR